MNGPKFGRIQPKLKEKLIVVKFKEIYTVLIVLRGNI